MTPTDPNPVRALIVRYFGTNKEASRVLGVTPLTVASWTYENPRGILKHAVQICDDYEVKPEELIDTVRQHLTHLNDQEKRSLDSGEDSGE